jgi:hypothetical protein
MTTRYDNTFTRHADELALIIWCDDRAEMRGQTPIDWEPAAEPSPTAVRLKLKTTGFSPIPLYGKEPPTKDNNPYGSLIGWQHLHDVPVEKIEAWERKWPDAGNTGILTYRTTAFDIDVMHAEAAEAVEALACERFGALGRILIRIGMAPKRAVLMRTEVPFSKIKRVFTSPDGSKHKIEILGNGQQLVVHGIHPDTKRPYTWTGGEPWTINRDELPELTEADALVFLVDAESLLAERFGFRLVKAERKDADGGGPSHDWEELISNILGGVELHDSIRTLAMKMVVSGTSPGAVVNQLRAFANASTTPHDERWQQRYDDIPRAVDTAVEKIRRTDLQATEAPSQCSLDKAHAVFRKWLGGEYDLDVLDAVLATAAAERLTGDPLWLLVVGGPGSPRLRRCRH